MAETSLIFALTVVYIILISICYNELCYEHIMTLAWENRNSYINLIEKFGLPTAVNTEKGGGAIWNNVNFVGSQRSEGSAQLTLFDQKFGVEPEPTIHVTVPIKLFAGINPQKVKVSDQGIQRRIGDIIGILPKYISYDPVKETITARFYNLSIVYYIITLCMKITTSELNTADARCLLAERFSIENSLRNDIFKENIASYQSERYISEYINFIE